MAVGVAGLSTWWWHQFRVGGLVFGVLVGVALLGRRRHPLVVLGAVMVLTGLVMPVVVEDSYLHEGMLLWALAVASYAVVAHAATVRAMVGGGVAALLWAGVLLSGRSAWPPGWAHLSFGETFDTTWRLIPLAAMVWAAGLSTRFLRLRRATAEDRRLTVERERAQSARLAVAEERAAIARELHDIVAHSLSVMVLQANGGEYALDRDPERTRQALRIISATGGDALEEIRQLVRMLRGATDDGLETGSSTPGGVAAAVERARASGLAVDLRQEGTAPRMPDGVALALFRIVQESLTNTLKHGGPGSTAIVRVRYSAGAVDVEVSDDGAGRAPVSGGHGLVGMRERALLYGGTFDAGPLLGGGWRVRARIPLSGETERVVRAVTV
ncbi:sensor histidine kinase [Actinoplanes sp. G11-F43]|uniref:sensor histidine kinase n=1 Tax=Actinoplanes sp. G11-F43 TaxID=3424130 RepID=UPI003D339CCB